MITEDDTFLRLQRISVSELEERCEWITTHIKRYEWQYAVARIKDEADIKKKARLNIICIGLLSPKVLYYVNKYEKAETDKTFQQVTNKAFEGLGWTLSSYKDVACNFYPTLLAKKKIHDRKKIRNRIVILSLFMIAIVSLMFFPWSLLIKFPIDICIGVMGGRVAAWSDTKYSIQEMRDERCPYGR